MANVLIKLLTNMKYTIKIRIGKLMRINETYSKLKTLKTKKVLTWVDKKIKIKFNTYINEEGCAVRMISFGSCSRS